MPMRIISGKTGAVTTGIETSSGVRNGQVITVEGPYETLKSVEAVKYVPSGFGLSNARMTSDGHGGGRLIISCEPYENEYAGTSPFRVSYKITMESVTKDLRLHPAIADSRATIERWLATDPTDRLSKNGQYQWVDEEGAKHQIDDERTLKFITAYTSGIESYVTHYPVIEKISHYKSIPGVSSYNGKMNGGNAHFSRDIDKWSAPDISLAGYSSDGWFKSGDGYEKDGGKAWIRTEQWNWTPEGSSSDLGWIYEGA